MDNVNVKHMYILNVYNGGLALMLYSNFLFVPNVQKEDQN